MKKMIDHIRQMIDHCVWAVDYGFLESADKVVIDELLKLKASAEKLLEIVESKQKAKQTKNTNPVNKNQPKQSHPKII